MWSNTDLFNLITSNKCYQDRRYHYWNDPDCDVTVGKTLLERFWRRAMFDRARPVSVCDMIWCTLMPH